LEGMARYCKVWEGSARCGKVVQGVVR
jgi:hypothetical protein